MLLDFKIACFRIELTAGNMGLILPRYKGSTLRGGFGSTFRKIACVCRDEECKSCLLKPNCPYAYIFETSPPENTQVLSQYESITKPFVLQPPMDFKTNYQKGEILAFNLVLFGKAIAYLPYFILAFKELGDAGIGKFRRPFSLERIVAENPFIAQEEEIYSQSEGKVLNSDLSVNKCDLLANLQNGSINEINIEYQTMTKIKSGDIFVRHIEFHMLIRALLRRLSSVYYFHHGLEWKIDFPGLIKKAEQVERVLDHTRWEDWERYSSRQDAKIKMGGVVGKVIYKGELSEFLPILKLGELLHVGKSSTFGMGRYKIL